MASKPVTLALQISIEPETEAREYPKRLTLDLTEDQHRKFKIYAATHELSMNEILRTFIDGLP